MMHSCGACQTVLEDHRAWLVHHARNHGTPILVGESLAGSVCRINEPELMASACVRALRSVVDSDYNTADVRMYA